MKKNVIITSANERHGNFLINHWLKSLKENVNLKEIDIFVIDYGLTPKQKKELILNNIPLFRGSRTNHITIQRFIDAGKILNKNNYEKILFCDGGDIIFQKDISHLFNLNGDFLCVPMDEEILFNERYIPLYFKNKYKKQVYHFLKDKPTFNAGFVVSPKNKFIKLVDGMNQLIKNKKNYGPDQVAFNYVVQKEGYTLLDKKYNFLVSVTKEDFILKNGVFYLKNSGDKIPIVHNAGWIGIWRPIINFGYGRTRNFHNYLIYFYKKIYVKFLSLIKSILSKIIYSS